MVAFCFNGVCKSAAYLLRIIEIPIAPTSSVGSYRGFASVRIILQKHTRFFFCSSSFFLSILASTNYSSELLFQGCIVQLGQCL